MAYLQDRTKEAEDVLARVLAEPWNLAEELDTVLQAAMVASGKGVVVGALVWIVWRLANV